MRPADGESSITVEVREHIPLSSLYKCICRSESGEYAKEVNLLCGVIKKWLGFGSSQGMAPH